MSNSADKSLDFDSPLDEDSDVIELTEEVPEDSEQDGDEEHADLFDDDDFDMPEFRMPDEQEGEAKPNGKVPAAHKGDAADHEDGETAPAQDPPQGEGALGENVPKAAIVGRRARKRQDTPHLDSMETMRLTPGAPQEQRQEQPSTDPEPPMPDEEPPAGLSSLEESSAITLDADMELQERRPSFDDEDAEPSAPEEATEKITPEQQEPHDEDLDDLDESSVPTMMIEAGSQTSNEDEHKAPPAAESSDTAAIVHESDAEAEEAYDRQELVRTMQMQAVDRHDVDLNIHMKRLAEAQPLSDQRFAPDVLTAPPRVLTKQWREGSPMSAKRPAPPTQRPANRPPQATPKAPPPNPQTHAKPEKPAPAPKQPDEGAQQPPKHASQPPEVKPEHASIPPEVEIEPLQSAPPGQSIQPKEGGDGDDPEMSGLVKELLDEGQQPAKAPQKKPRTKKQSVRDGWFKSVFTEEYLRTLPPNIDEVTDRDVDFIEQSLSLQEGSRILDLACGFGRHALTLAPNGYEIVGLDISMPLLQRGLAEAQRRNLSIKFVHGDMRSMNFNQIFDGCYLWQTSFGYFDDPTNFQVLQGVKRALKPGGRFLLDVANRDYLIREMPARSWWEGRECIFLEEVDLDHTTSVLHTKRSFIYEDGSPPLEQNSYVRVYSMHELVHLLRSAGFRVLEVSGELHHRGRFLGPNSPRIVVLAEKLPPKKQR